MSSPIDQPGPVAADQLLPLVYDELRRLAAARMARERPGTLDATALVHEVYLRLSASGVTWQGRGHFLVVAAEAMRRILIDRARKRQAEKHGGGRVRVEAISLPAEERDPDELLALDEALAKLALEDAQAAEVARLRVYAGLSVEEAGDALGLSRTQAYRHWSYARAWLRCELAGDVPD